MSASQVSKHLRMSAKWRKLSWRAKGVWVEGLSWCAEKLSDGRISVEATRIHKMPKTAIAELVKAGMWEVAEDGNGWVYHDYLDWNPSRAEVEDERESARKRMAETRAKKRAEMSVSSKEQSYIVDAEVSENAAVVYELSPTRFAQKAGAAWYERLTDKKPDPAWNAELGRIGMKPEGEREKVLEHVRATSYFQKRPTSVSPAHIAKFWDDFVAGPRELERPLAWTRPAPGAPSSTTDIQAAAETNPDWIEEAAQ